MYENCASHTVMRHRNMCDTRCASIWSTCRECYRKSIGNIKRLEFLVSHSFFLFSFKPFIAKGDQYLLGVCMSKCVLCFFSFFFLFRFIGVHLLCICMHIYSQIFTSSRLYFLFILHIEYKIIQENEESDDVLFFSFCCCCCV